MTSFPIEPARAPIRPARYRPDIDGLRAIAVLVVVGYHAFPDWVRGGFVGVDVFFVISGYLITGIIFRHVCAGDFSIVDFYNKRIQRIFPALLLVTFFAFLIGWFVLAPRDFESLGTNIAGGALFVQNFVLLGQVGYFDIEASKKPLLHLWSLGIEEQYYIAWPLLLLMFRRERLNALTLSVVLIVASLGFGVVAFKLGPDYAFYLPFSRAWELLVGSAVSIFLVIGRDVPATRRLAGEIRFGAAFVEDGLQQIVWAPGAPRRGHLVQEMLAGCALVAVAFAVARYKPYTPYPGSAALITVAAATVLILTPGTAINRVFLSSRPMVFIGLISYPLYLWHFPLMAYARILSGDAVSPLEMAGIIVISVLLAWATYRFVEWPIRHGPTISRIRIAALGTGMASIGALGLVVMVTQGFPIRIPKALRGFMLTGDETSVFWRRGHCLMLPEQSAKDFASECAGSGPRPLLFTWGDSYARRPLPRSQTFRRTARVQHFGIHGVRVPSFDWLRLSRATILQADQRLCPDENRRGTSRCRDFAFDMGDKRKRAGNGARHDRHKIKGPAYQEDRASRSGGQLARRRARGKHAGILLPARSYVDSRAHHLPLQRRVDAKDRCLAAGPSRKTRYQLRFCTERHVQRRRVSGAHRRERLRNHRVRLGPSHEGRSDLRHRFDHRPIVAHERGRIGDEHEPPEQIDNNRAVVTRPSSEVLAPYRRPTSHARRGYRRGFRRSG